MRAYSPMDDSDRQVTPMAKLAALLEVVLVFAALHVTYRGIKHFSAWGSFEGSLGLNLTPGIAMIAFTFGMIALHGRAWRSYGLILDDWRQHASLAIVCILVAAAVVGPLLLWFAPHHDPRPAPRAVQAIIGTAANLAAALIFLVVMRRCSWPMTGLPPMVSMPLIAAIAASPVLVAAWRHKPVEPAAIEALWLFIGAGFGEELFFRGYVQSRVDQAFGQPWSVLGTLLGPGVLVSAALFGMIHVLNPVDYFHGRFDFAWWWFPNEFAAGLVMGCIRARTGSVLPCAVLHGLGDIIGTLPGLFG